MPERLLFRRWSPAEDELPLSAASAAALSIAIRSASKAASSASGESGIVSKLEMLGLLERVEVGVEGRDEFDEKETW